METGESFWVSGVKKNGQDRHWAGFGKVMVEARRFLNIWGSSALVPSTKHVAK
jgi:hypothetical protein